MNSNQLQSHYFKTPLGIAKITGDSLGIAQILITDRGDISTSIPLVLEKAVLQINEYFLGNRIDFDFECNPSGTDFQQKVWAELRQIPHGKTLSYMQLSKKMGDPKAVRAVAAANGKNPLWIVVPCHRVIGSDGSLTGYAGGLWRKKWLLEHENPSLQQNLF